MTSPDAAFEAALPESSAHPWLRGHGDPQYTIDQMRAMFDAGWNARGEADAMVCEAKAWEHPNASVLGPELNCQACATAIRGMK